VSVVILGAGLGALRVAETLRRSGFVGAIDVVGAEEHPPYDRPPLTKALLRGEITHTTLKPDLADLDVRSHLGVAVTAVDPMTHIVTLADGRTLGYRALVIATGASPRRLRDVPPGDGLHVVRTVDDARRLRTALAAARPLVVVGAGFVGCEVAASARQAGVEVDLVETLPGPLYRALGDPAAGIVRTLLTDRGVRVHAPASVAEISAPDSNGTRTVSLDNGTVVTQCEVVLGLGVVPATGSLIGSGIELADGVVCDAGGHTSAPDVWAVGDVARWHHPLAGASVRVEHWTSAGEQARIVGSNVAATLDGGTRTELSTNDVPYFWSDVFDVKIQALGFVDPNDVVQVTEPAGRPVLVYSRDERLRAVVGFGAPARVARLRSAVASGAPAAEVVAGLQR